MQPREVTAADLFTGSDETQILLRSMDWSATALGPVPGWPDELCAAVRLILASRTPMEVDWGTDLIRLYNDAARPNLGERHPAALGRPWGEDWPEMWEAGGAGLRAVLDGQGARHAEHFPMLMNRSGYLEETYWTISTSPITSPTGTIGGVLVVPLEVTGQVLQSRRLQAVRDLGGISATTARTAVATCQALFAVLERDRSAMPCAWIYLRGEAGAALRCVASMGVHADLAQLRSDCAGPDGDDPAEHVLASRQPELLTGLRQRFRPGTLMTSPLGTLLPDEAMVYPLQAGDRRAANGVLVVGISPYRRLDESYRTFLDVAAHQVSVTINDAQALEAESDRVSALAALDAEKTRFLQNVSHEFRTPLTLVLGPLQSILDSDEVSVPTRHREALQAAHAATLELSRRVDTLLDFDRAEAGDLRPQFQPTDLAALTSEVAGLFRASIQRAGLSLRIDAPTLPGLVDVDRQMWSQIIVNLLANAIKFTAHGAVAIRLRAAGAQVRLAVADTGSGIHADDVDKVFQRYYQASGDSSHGTGIGLSLVADLVRAHAGQVRVKSAPGKGSVFTVTVPIGQSVDRSDTRGVGSGLPVPLAEQSPPGAYRHWRAKSAPDAGQSTRQLLVVEDHADLRRYLTRLFTDDGWIVNAVPTAEAALTVATAPDVVLSDILLPGRSGIDLLHALRADPTHDGLPILLLTGQAAGPAVAAALHAGANDYIVKPFEPVELLARVRMHYDLARRRQQADEHTKNLRIALSSNRTISYAIGILMAQRKVTADDSFKLLREYARNTNRKLGDVADDVVLTGALPTGAAPVR